MHLTIDGKCESAGLLADKDLLRELLLSLPTDIGMTLIAGPHIVPYFTEVAFPDLKGYQGWVIIAESHIIITTNIKEGLVNIDCFSCKDFNADKVERIIAGAYKLSRVRKNLLDRTAGHEEL